MKWSISRIISICLRVSSRVYKLLDLFCGAGGCSMGYWKAGFHDITGIDNKPQKNYPFDFHQADVFEWCAENDLSQYDLIHASPPCQKFTALNKMWNAKSHEDLIDPMRFMLREFAGRWVIENVPGAPLYAPVILCGTMFGLGCDGAELWRHRLFEANFPLSIPPECQHRKKPRVIGVYGGHGMDRRRKVNTQDFSVEQRKEAMGIWWMNGIELSQAIPPAYTEWIGKQILKCIKK